MLERISTHLTAAKPVLPANAAWLVLAIFFGSALAAGVREEAIGIAFPEESVVSRTYLAGFNNHFVKLRVSHLRASGKEADEFVQQVRRILGKCG